MASNAYAEPMTRQPIGTSEPSRLITSLLNHSTIRAAQPRQIAKLLPRTNGAAFGAARQAFCFVL
jgi:hypothetical protein